jgi:hypothetical protein
MSDPPGAVVTTAGLSCKTPCTLDVPVRTASAVFTLDSGLSKEISIRHLTGRGATARYGVTKGGEYGLLSIGAPLLIAGGFTVVVLGLLYDTDSEPEQFQLSSDDAKAFYAIGGALVVGGALAYLADGVGETADDISPEVFVSFDDFKDSPSEKELEEWRNGFLKDITRLPQ